MAIKKRNKTSAEFSMASMTDIIFLLLIFFMLTSTLVSQNALNLKLPSSNSKTVAPQSLAVSIKKDGTYYFGTQSMTLPTIERQIQNELKTQGQASERATLTIMSEAMTPIEYVVNVMDMANKLRINAILATEPKK
jgi:biopolymer transport protein ExbD